MKTWGISPHKSETCPICQGRAESQEEWHPAAKVVCPMVISAVICPMRLSFGPNGSESKKWYDYNQTRRLHYLNMILRLEPFT